MAGELVAGTVFDELGGTAFYKGRPARRVDQRRPHLGIGIPCERGFALLSGCLRMLHKPFRRQQGVFQRVGCGMKSGGFGAHAFGRFPLDAVSQVLLYFGS